LRTYTKLKKQTTEDEALSVLTCATIEKQADNQPVHTWTEPELHDLKDYQPGQLKVSEFMSTDLITVQKDDIIQLVAEMMDWRKVRYTPVEDQKGKLIGLVTSRKLLRHFLKKDRLSEGASESVAEIMISDPITIEPDASIQDAMEKMRSHGIGCLPVVKDKDLIGMITEMDFLRISGRLIERMGKTES
jgi:CBS domain-containing protein